MYFDVKRPGNKSTGDGTLIKLLKSPAIMASGSSTIFLPTDPKELCARLKILLQERRTGNISKIFDEEIIAIVDELLEYNVNLKNKITNF